ncbi:MAG: hypothetical protein AAGF11_16185 [Myxococcota bacterium]
MNGLKTLRHKARPWALVRQTMGGPQAIRTKIRDLVTAVSHYGREDLVRRRLERLERLGHIDSIPNRIQRVVGAIDMMRFFIVPAAADYYEEKGLDFHFHQLLRFLDDPASLIDPTGLHSTRDNIIGHVMQVVHANPEYDFQLLDTFEDGMEQMERQVRELLAGTHPRAASIRAIVEEPDYHERLLAHIKAYRANSEQTTRFVRPNVAAKFRAEERTFGTVPAAMRYFSRMPSTLPDAVTHLMLVRRFPIHLAEPEPPPAMAPSRVHRERVAHASS